MNSGTQIDIKNPDNTFILLPAKKRLDFIIDHKTPMELVRSLSSPDLLLTIREVGAEDALELFLLLHPKQVQEIFDLELWAGDELNIKAAGHYFSLLFEASPDKAISQIYGLDRELVGLMFKLSADIYDVSIGEEPPADFSGLYSLSPDGHFMVCFHEDAEKKELAQSLYQLLETLYGRDFPFAKQLLENIRFELASSLEEESLRWRNNRMLDLGILPRLERLQFFAPLYPRLSVAAKKNGDTMRSFSPALTVFRDFGLLSYPYLQTGLKDCSDEDKTYFWQCMLHAGINMFASLSGDFGDKEEQRKVFDYVKFLTELGVFQACEGRIDNATSVLKETSPYYLIRLGRTALVTLRKRLLSHSNNKDFIFGHHYCHVDSPLREVARALVLPEPRFYEGLNNGAKLSVRYFSSLRELEATVEAINELLFRASFIGKHGLDIVAIEHYPELCHASIFARVLVNDFGGRPSSLDRVSRENVQKIFGINQQLTREFSQHARDFSTCVAQKMALSSNENLETVERRIMQFLTTILIELEKNWRLLLGD